MLKSVKLSFNQNNFTLRIVVIDEKKEDRFLFIKFKMEQVRLFTKTATRESGRFLLSAAFLEFSKIFKFQ